MKRICFLVTVLAIVMMAFGCSDDKKEVTFDDVKDAIASSCETMTGCENVDTDDVKECKESGEEYVKHFENYDKCYEEFEAVFKCDAKKTTCDNLDNTLGDNCPDETKSLDKCLENANKSASDKNSNDDDKGGSDKAVDLSSSINAYCSKIEACGAGTAANCIAANPADEYPAECKAVVKEAFDCIATSACDDLTAGTTCKSEIQAAAAKGCVESKDFTDDDDNNQGGDDDDFGGDDDDFGGNDDDFGGDDF